MAILWTCPSPHKTYPAKHSVVPVSLRHIPGKSHIPVTSPLKLLV